MAQSREFLKGELDWHKIVWLIDLVCESKLFETDSQQLAQVSVNATFAGADGFFFAESEFAENSSALYVGATADFFGEVAD